MCFSISGIIHLITQWNNCLNIVIFVIYFPFQVIHYPNVIFTNPQNILLFHFIFGKKSIRLKIRNNVLNSKLVKILVGVLFSVVNNTNQNESFGFRYIS